MREIFKLDPEGAILAYQTMMKKKISMPAKEMYDGEDRNLFDKFSDVAQNLGVYTVHDYANNVQHFNEQWDISHIGLSGHKRVWSRDVEHVEEFWDVDVQTGQEPWARRWA